MSVEMFSRIFPLHSITRGTTRRDVAVDISESGVNPIDPYVIGGAAVRTGSTNHIHKLGFGYHKFLLALLCTTFINGIRLIF
jgi:hypothetical protein